MVNQKGVHMVFFSCVIFAVFSGSLYALEIDTPKATGYITHYSHTFELENKDKQPIQLKIAQKRNFEEVEIFNKKITTYARLGVSYFSLDHENPLLVSITDAQGKTHSYEIKPKLDTLKVLVTYHNGKLIPQWGSYAGMSSYTKSGLPLIGNISQQQIKKVS